MSPQRNTAAVTRRTLQALRVALIAALALLYLMPLYWMISTSFKLQPEIFRLPPTLVPEAPTLDNYRGVIAGTMALAIPFLVYFKNSLAVTVLTVLATLLLATPAAYAFSRVRFRGKRNLIYFVLVSQMLPVVLILIPLYQTFLRLRLLSTYPGLVLPYLMLTLPFSIWMLKGYFDSIPRELDEAARVDGCTKGQTMVRVILPNVAPGLTATAIVTFIMAWDEFIIALTIMDANRMRTLPVGMIQSFVGQFSIKWGEMMAASVITTIPVVLIFVFLSKYLIGGLIAGAVKG
ncbi:MAG: carbohydrate ABC transporter permease [Spirochaetales bacterium]|nr:carbohydrate ABC transporter permease [Spirochaetales bacterium]